jgi:hypothetical protein
VPNALKPLTVHKDVKGIAFHSTHDLTLVSIKLYEEKAKIHIIVPFKDDVLMLFNLS